MLIEMASNQYNFKGLETAFAEDNMYERITLHENQAILRLLRLVPEKTILQKVMSSIVNSSFMETLPLVGIMLQYSNSFNLALLHYCVEHRLELEEILAN